MEGNDIKTALILADVQLEIRRLLMAGVELADILMRVNWLLLDAGGEGIRVCACARRSGFPGSPTHPRQRRLPSARRVPR